MKPCPLRARAAALPPAEVDACPRLLTPCEPESSAPDAPDQDAWKAPSASRAQKRDAATVWPRDLNAPSRDKPEWGSDPEALRDA